MVEKRVCDFGGVEELPHGREQFIYTNGVPVRPIIVLIIGDDVKGGWWYGGSVQIFCFVEMPVRRLHRLRNAMELKILGDGDS